MSGRGIAPSGVQDQRQRSHHKIHHNVLQVTHIFEIRSGLVDIRVPRLFWSARTASGNEKSDEARFQSRRPAQRRADLSQLSDLAVRAPLQRKAWHVVAARPLNVALSHTTSLTDAVIPGARF